MARRLKPRMPIRGVIDHEIHNDTNAALLGSVRELDEIAQRAVARIHPVVIGNIVAIVAIGRWLERHQPDRRDTESVQVVETSCEPLKVADSIPVCIHEGGNGETIDHSVLVPKVINHWRGTNLKG